MLDRVRELSEVAAFARCLRHPPGGPATRDGRRMALMYWAGVVPRGDEGVAFCSAAAVFCGGRLAPWPEAGAAAHASGDLRLAREIQDLAICAPRSERLRGDLARGLPASAIPRSSESRASAGT